MLRRLAIASVLLAAAGCATQQEAQKKQGPAAPTEQRMRIINQHPFDVGVCQPKSLTLPQPANEGILVGAVLTTRPQVMECLVDPKTRGPAETTNVVVTTTVNDQGGTHTVAGENLTPEGVACIQKIVDARVPLTALPKGAQPVKSETTFVHELANSANVKFGNNPGSDFSGNVRLGQSSWCDCYAPFSGKTPPILKANVELKREAPPADAKKEAQADTKQEAKPEAKTVSSITFDPAGTPEGDQLAACLQAKMMAVPATVDVDQLKFSYRFIHFNSQATEPAAVLPPELRFLQLDLVRGQRSAEAAIAVGARTNAAEAYDTIVKQYQKKADWKLVDELKARCKTLVGAAQGIVNALDAQLQVDQTTLALIQELKAKDATHWADAETKSQEIITVTQQDLDNAKKQVEADQKICPKERK